MRWERSKNVQAAWRPAKLAPVDVARLRHPMERRIFVASVVVNLALMAAAVYLAALDTSWLKLHPFLSKYATAIRVTAIAALFALPATVFLRNTRLAIVRGNSVRLSATQIPEIFSILVDQCSILGLNAVPDLYLSHSAACGTTRGYSTWSKHYIVLGDKFLEHKPEQSRDVIAFLLGCELGRICLGHTRLWEEILVSYVVKIPCLRTPLMRVRTYSCDRYGAWLAPDGFAGLLVQASGKLLLRQVNVDSYFSETIQPDSFWTRLADLTRDSPRIASRVCQLKSSGLFFHQDGAIGERAPSRTRRVVA